MQPSSGFLLVQSETLGAVSTPSIIFSSNTCACAAYVNAGMRVFFLACGILGLGFGFRAQNAGLPANYMALYLLLKLGISTRTVEAHRANLTHKLGVRSMSDVLRLAFAARLHTSSGE